MAFAPRQTIEAPPRRPIPFGLFTVVSLAEAATERWENGVTWEGLQCGNELSIVVGDCDAPEGYPKQFPDLPGPQEADAFTVYGTYKCSGPGAVKVAQDRAMETLLAGEEKAAERRLWQTLDDAPTVIAGGDPLFTLGQLEQWIADEYGSLGVIHVSRRAGTILAKRARLTEKGGTLYTPLGTPVVAGSGYPGTGVAGAAPTAGQEFIAATGGLFGYRSQTFAPTDGSGEDIFDRQNNDVFGIAERNYLIGHDDCGVAFAPMDLQTDGGFGA